MRGGLENAGNRSWNDMENHTMFQDASQHRHCHHVSTAQLNVISCVAAQGTSKSMPWLADLVESNDSSLDVLPVQCLCEFLLHDSTSDVATASAVNDQPQADRSKKQVLCLLQLSWQVLPQLRSSTRSGFLAVVWVSGYFLAMSGFFM